jgi:glycerol-3-phosphate acyltransferase PlsY
MGAGWSDAAVLALAAGTGFLVGAINPATLIAKARGIDLASSGSGNPGATNAGRVLGRRTGVLVGVLDVLKGLVPTLVFGLVGPGAAETAGFFAVLGHIFSPFLRGHGGKGVATTLGAILGVQAVWLLAVLPAFALGYLVTRRVGIGSVLGALALIACGLWWAGSTDQRIFALALGVLILIRHQGNVVQGWRDLRAARPSQG